MEFAYKWNGLQVEELENVPINKARSPFQQTNPNFFPFHLKSFHLYLKLDTSVQQTATITH
jgi:hypothetical protein